MKVEIGERIIFVVSETFSEFSADFESDDGEYLGEESDRNCPNLKFKIFKAPLLRIIFFNERELV